MLSEILVSFSDHIKKTRNPFFGTFIIVWVVRNWQFIITVFNLDLYSTLDAKIEVLKTYFADTTILSGFFNTAWISIVAIIVSYTLLNISRAIINTFENKVTPWVYKITQPKAIVLKSDYDLLQKKLDKLEVRLTEERSKRIEAEESRDKLQANQNTIASPEISKENNEDSEVSAMVELLVQRNLLHRVGPIITTIRRKAALDNQDMEPFLKLGLVNFNGNSVSGKGIYNFSPFGEKVIANLNAKGMIE
jgi:hypothetical protein